MSAAGRAGQGEGSREQEPERAENMDDDTFENLEVWQEAIELAARVYELFRQCRDFSFRDQIHRAAVSISNNIAEGYERDSNADFIRFLFIAKGSCGEVRSQAYLARRVRLLADADAKQLVADAKRLSKRIKRLIDSRRDNFS
jgi:four helix bundle protein